MDHSRMATTIPKTSFWAQRLQAVESTSDIPGFFDKTPAPSSPTSASPISTMAPVSMQNETEGLGQTATVVAANPVDLQVAALMHHLSADTIVCAAWAVLLRSYAGEDGVFNFGVCLDRDRAAWLSTMTVSGDEPLLSALRAAEQDKKLTLGHALAFESLGAFTKSTGYESIATAVYVHARKPKFSDMHSPSMSTLVVNITEGAMVKVHLNFRKDMLSGDRAQSVVDNYGHVLRTMTKQIQAVNEFEATKLLVKDIDTVSNTDLRRIVDLSAPLPQRLDVCVHELILARSADPILSQRIAVAAWDGSFTYAELAQHAVYLAGVIHNAIQLNPPAEGEQSYVPFCLTKSKWTPVAILAILTAGGACVPLEPTHPPARRNEILAQTNANLVLTNATLRASLSESVSGKTAVEHILLVDQVDPTYPALPPSSLPPVDPADLCYVIFTSGSSGTPKGVKWAHNALATSIWEHGRAFHMNEQSRVLQFASHVFDVSVSELITPLVHGGCVVVPSDDDRVDPSKMAQFIQSSNVNCALLVASYARLLCPATVPSLKTLILGGESIGQDNIDKWTPVLDRLIIGYGSAETCINCAKNEFSVVTQSQWPWKESLGFAVGGRMLIADRANPDRLVPIGAVGEIVVEGPILSEGYLNDDAKTTKSFIENPAWIRRTHFRPTSPRRRFYRTGDLGRQGMDGSITFVGRADFQVKVRGQRMELGEVRSHIVECLAEAVDIHVDVIAPGGEKALAAFLSFGQRNAAEKEAIQTHQPDQNLTSSLRRMVETLRQTLPAAAIPSFFIPLAGFPYLVSGKVDRRRLLSFANDSSVEELASHYSGFMAIEATVAPASEMEEMLVDCCREVLRMPSLGAKDNFFTSGGDSISAIKVVAAARTKGVEVTVADIFNTATIGSLAQIAHPTEDWDDYVEIEAPVAFSLLPLDLAVEIVADVQVQGSPEDEVVDVYPCTPIQEALIAISSMRPGAYVAQHKLELPTHVSIASFKASWAAAFQKYDILRTRILEGPHGAVQVVYDSKIEWQPTGADVETYCQYDNALPMGFGDALVRFGLVGRTFIFTIHHSLFDGWSITRLFEDVERHYANQTLLDIKQYNIYIKHLGSIGARDANQFWLSQLSPPENGNGLAACHFPQTVSSYTPIPDCETRLAISTAEYGSSEFTMPTCIRAAWALLVGRYLDSRDVIFGETLSGRTSTMGGVESVAGPTISTVPVRVKWESGDSIVSLLRYIQHQLVEITNASHVGLQNISRLSPAAHEACQFQHIIVVQPKRSSLRSATPQSDADNNSTDTIEHGIGLQNVSVDLRNFHNYALNMDFMLEDFGGVVVSTTFDSTVFDITQIQHIQAQFSHILGQICRIRNNAAGQSEIGDIEYACSRDWELQIESNRLALPSPHGYEHTTLIKTLEAHAVNQPDAVAIDSWDGSMSYKELNFTSTKLARHLSSSGIKKGDFVPYFFHKSMWTAVAIIATLKIGAVSVAVEPSHPESSIKKVLTQINAKSVLCSNGLSSRVQSLGYQPITVDAKSVNAVARLSVGAVEVKTTVQANDLAFMVFTSGSTGEPKGIPLEHGAVCLMAKQHGRVMNINKSSRILQFAAYVFDVSIGDLAISIYHGACLCVPSDVDRMNDLARAVNSLRANRAWLTPTVAALISPAECPTIEWLSVGGEQLTQICKDIWDGIPLVNVYGPAEVTNLGTAVRVAHDTPLANLGRANGTRMWICEQGNPQKLAPAGCIGEIVFEGPNVTRGYLGDAERTRASFPEIFPWAPDEGFEGEAVRMYRTGDLARLNVDGSLDFKGRKDTQIKLRGQRIEVTAVESAMQAAVNEPVELAVDILAGFGGDPLLVAFLHLPQRLAAVTTNAPIKPTTGATNNELTTGLFSSIDITSTAISIRSYVESILPPHMIPSLFIPLNHLPRLVSGKIDRKFLRQAASKLTDEEISKFKLDRAAGQRREPSTGRETALRKMWASVLRLPESDIGVDDNFVSLGGDSITAIKLVAHARARGLHFTVSFIFSHGTISRMCASLDGDEPTIDGALARPEPTANTNTPVATQATSVTPVNIPAPLDIADLAAQCGIPSDQVEDVYRCTALQEGMLMMTEKTPTAYVAHHVMELPSWVDIGVFRRAWEEVVHENAILRTRIVPSGMQVVFHPAVVTLRWDSPASDDLDAYVREICSEPMGFGSSLTRQAILENPKRFIWTAHHSVYDGWSMPLLAETITKNYMRLAVGGRLLSDHGSETEISSAPTPSISFKDFVDWIVRTDETQTQEFWRDQLQGADPPVFPPRIPTSCQPLADSMLEKTIPFPRNPKSTATAATIIRAAWSLLISSYTGSHSDIVFGSAVTGRSVPLDGVLSLIGPTLATVPVRVTLNREQPVGELLQALQKQSVSMLEYEQYGLQNIRKSCPAAAAACDFQSLLVVHAETEAASSGDVFSWSNERSESDFLTTALTLECQPTGCSLSTSALDLVASYDSSIINERQLERMLATFEYILQQLCSDSDGCALVRDIDTLSPGDKQEIGAMVQTLPKRVDGLVHDMFSRQAAATPNASAVSASDGNFTYEQLDSLSTKLAHLLLSLGLVHNRFVPFCFEKSKWVPVALLGILKAGGACVPLDPAQPLDRLQGIISALEATIVLTSTTHADLLKGCKPLRHFIEVSGPSLSSMLLPKHGGSAHAIRCNVLPSSACYAIFTSGSTGTPKGVVWEHAALCTSMTEHGAAFNYSTQSRVLQFASHTFDVSVSELLTTLVFGGCVCIPDDFTRLNGIAGFMEEERVNWAFFAPSFARLMDPKSVPGLQTIVLGGEAPGRDNIERWSGRPGLELIVTYGPAESCIYCAKNSVYGPQIDGSIGRSIGGMMWVADLGRPTELAPIGAVGEIVIEGGILARGYLGDQAKTEASFRPMPKKWAHGRSFRVYYTGDLGCINSDGTISCLGRRDDQVKIRGQRVELADIEYHLRKDESVRQALVLYPRSGPCADHLVGILSMGSENDNDTTTRPTPSSDIQLAPAEAWPSTYDVQERIVEKVPAYMVPSIWIVLDSIPLMPASQKVNRKLVNEWTKAMDQTTYELIAGMSSAAATPTKAPAMNGEMEEKVRELWSSVLNVKSDIIGPNTSFLRLGGDSISAMQIIARCRDQGIHVTVQDLLKSRTLADFCARVRAGAATVGRHMGDLTISEEASSIGSSFDLSPIQSWFMNLAPGGENYFNQSHLLRFTSEIQFERLHDALVLIVERHPMLRARFQMTEDGTWQQRISDDADGSLQTRLFKSVSRKKLSSFAANCQASLDIIDGPLLAADMYKMTDGAAALFITCHHLVVDLVSWRIILQELEEILRDGKTASDRQPFSFQTWCRLLDDHANPSPASEEENSLLDSIPLPDFDFWGISSSQNVPAHVVERSFSLDQETTELLLGRSNDAFMTEPLDLLIAAIVSSFNDVFRDIRGPVTVFNEGHGREPWRPDIDLSSTVGWFTSMCPVLLADNNGQTNILSLLREAKDFRRQIPEKGLPFFSALAKRHAALSSPVEVTVNYFGLYQQLERDDALFNRMSWGASTQPPDSSPDVCRFSIFDVSARVENGVMSVGFAFSNEMKHQDRIHRWVEACSNVLQDLIRITSEQENRSLTLSDLPHLPVSYNELDALLTQTLPNSGIRAVDVQDMYPCSPMQTALLVNQVMDPSLYAVRYVWEVMPKSSGQPRVSAERVVQAWKRVVSQHPMLRTAFIQGAPSHSSSGEGKPVAVYNQVVLKEHDPAVLLWKDPSSFPVGQPQDHIALRGAGSPHHVVLCEAENSGRVQVQLDVSHALIDGTSVMLLIDNFIKAYDGNSATNGFEATAQDCYANYVTYLNSQDLDVARGFWKDHLVGVDSCFFPSLLTNRGEPDSDSPLATDAQPAAARLDYLEFSYPNPARLHSFCNAAETTAASVYKLAWALLLRAFTGNNTPCFGYLASGRDLPIDGIESSIGPFINMLVCRIPLGEDSNATVEAALRTIHADYANCLSHQVCSLSEILRGLESGGGRLFNTVMSVQRHAPPGTSTSSIDVKTVHVEDPSEFDIVVNIGDSTDVIDVSLTYNTTILASEHAQRLASTFNQAIDGVLDSMTSPINSISLLSDADRQQISRWNNGDTAPQAISALCDDLVSQNLVLNGSKTAVSGWDISMTYAELDGMSIALSRYLLAKHPEVTPNSLIPICFEKSAWAIVAMLGIIKAGAAFVVLDPKHPVDRLAHIVKRVRAPVTICSEKHESIAASLVQPSNGQHFALGPNTVDGIRIAAQRYSNSFYASSRRQRSPSDLAYCLFTSGSTGTPKGVLIQHGALCSSATMHGRTFGYTDQSRSLQFAAYSFDVCISEIFATLIIGGCVCVPSDEQRMDPQELTRYVQRERVNIAFFTPSFLPLLDPARLPTLTTLLIGGEAVGQQIIQQWQRPSSRAVSVAYGPTECCVYCVGHNYSWPHDLTPGINLIGTGVGCITWIADLEDYNRLVPVGALGELLIEGPILAKGYFDDQEKTASAFVRPTWASGDNSRVVYRTGDLVRYRQDGRIEYLGRRDNQVKLRGQRLELSEIEQQLIKHPEVRQCVVLLPKDGVSKHKITVVMTLSSGVDPSSRLVSTLSPSKASSDSGMRIYGGQSISDKVSSICESVAESLPPYMVPSCWIVTDTLPLLPSGKADGRFISGCIANINEETHKLSIDLASPAVGDNESIPTGAQQAGQATDPIVKTVREAWSAVLNIPVQRINPSKGSFIRMGGDSISALEVVARCRAQGIPVLIEQLLKATSVDALASSIDKSKLTMVTKSPTKSTPNLLPAGPDNASSQIDEDDDEKERVVLFGLSPIQRMFTRLSPNENHYNQSFLVKVSTDKTRVSEDGLRQALNAIVKRHAMLRARFQKLGKAFKQWIEPCVEDSYVFKSWDIPAPTSGHFPTEIAQQIHQTQRSLDLVDGPVFAGDLFEAGKEQYIFLAAHHLVVDLVSWRIILKDLEDYLTTGSISSYRSLSFEKWCGLLNTRRKALMALPTPSRIPFEVPDPDYAYWDMVGKPNFAADFERHQFTLSQATSQALLGSCNDAFGTEALDLFISAVMHSFSTTFPDRGIPPVYNEGHGREPWDASLDLSRTVGWFTTIAPVWIDKANQPTAEDLVEYVKQVKDARRNTPNKGFDYFTSLDLEKRPFATEVIFNYFGSFQQLDRSDALLKQVHWRNIDTNPCEVSKRQEKFSLIEINAETELDTLVFTFSFNSKISRAGHIREWVNHCQESLGEMARLLDAREVQHTVSDFDHLPQHYNLRGLRETVLKQLAIPESNVEDIYPCAQTQQGMLLTQSKDPEMYWFRTVYEVQQSDRTNGRHNAVITPENLRQAWIRVVQRHPILRTVYFEQNSTDGLYDQLILRNYEPSIAEEEIPVSVPEAELMAWLKFDLVPTELQTFREPQHRLRIVRQSSTGRLFCSFLISHTIIDGSSMGIIIRDLGRACRGRLIEKAADDLQYKNYITYLRSRNQASDVAYWKNILEGTEPCFFPSKVQSTAMVTSKAPTPQELRRATVLQDGTMYTKAQKVARELGVSPFTMLQTAWALALREYVDPSRDECCFGVVTSGRDLPVNGIQDIAGPFVNILASRVALPHDQPVSRIAEAIHEQFVDNLAHQTSSLAEIQHELKSGPLFNTGITMQRVQSGPEEKDDVSFRPVGGEDPTEFDVVAHAIDDGQVLSIHLTHWRHKVSDRRADDLASTFASILSQILNQPYMLPMHLHTVSDRDIRQLWSWNADLPPPSDQRIEDMIANQVIQNPGQEALWSTKEVLSYEQLDQFSTQFSQRYLSLVEREEIVPLCFEKSVWTAVAMVAVLKAGGTIVLIDPSHPVERLKSIVNTVKAKLILASPCQADMCEKELGVHTVAVSRDNFYANNSPANNRRVLTKSRGSHLKSSSDAAYIVFTSGSTGTPKGSVTEHTSFCTATRGYHKAIGQLPGTRVLQFASYSFDASVLEILGSLMVGATVCVPSDQERSNQLTSFINRASVSFAVITPTVASLLSPEEVPRLTNLALCGEPMTTGHITKWADKVRLVNAFGPSECCVGSAANPRVRIGDSPKCIGWAVSCCYWVVHPRNHNRLTRIGAVGELLIEGPILARHYLGEEAKTKEAFITAPEWACSGRATRLYKTGDLVCQNPDGSFQYIGRKDTQAKIRGQRFEFGDVEQAFRDVVPESNSVVAEVVQGAKDGAPNRLVLFFSSTAVDPDHVDAVAIQSEMATKIPAYMVPSAIIALDEMPLMPSGKVDRKKIRGLGAALPTRQEKRRPPKEQDLSTNMEVVLAAVWKDVIQPDKAILAGDSFFEIGGDSYTAMKLVTEARARGVLLNVATVMQTPKLSDMASKSRWANDNTVKSYNINGEKNKNTTPENTVTPFSLINFSTSMRNEVSRQCRVSPDDVEDIYPCTPLQEGLFVLSVKQPGSYIAQHCYQLPAELDMARYKDAWRTIYDSNAILRTHIVQLDNAGGNETRQSGLYQVVVKKPLVWTQANSLDNHLASRPPTPSLGTPLVQLTIIEEINGRRFLVLTMHHATYDASSLEMLLQSAETVYTGGQVPSSTPFKEFIRDMQSTQGQETRDFWTNYLAGFKASELSNAPTGYVPSADSTFETTVSMPRFNSRAHTMSTVIRVAWAFVLAQHMGSSDVVVGETLSGRNDDSRGGGVVDVQGPLITTVPTRYVFSNKDDITSILSAVQSNMVDMIPFQQAGLQNIRFMNGDAAAACNFCCLVTIAPNMGPGENLGLGITAIESQSPPAMDYAMSIQFVLGEKNAIGISVCHDNNLIDCKQMRELVENFESVLAQICKGEKMTAMDIGMNMRPSLREIHTDENTAALAGNPLGVLGGVLEVLPTTAAMQEQDSNMPQTLEETLAAVGVDNNRDLERDMRDLWVEVLRIDQEDLSSQDNFFHIGGDSISAMRLVTAAEHKHIQITVADIFHHPTLEALCRFASQSNMSAPAGEAIDGTTNSEPAAESSTRTAATAGLRSNNQLKYKPYDVLDLLDVPREDVVEAVCRQLSVFPGDVEDVYPATDYQAWAVSHGLMHSRGNTNYFLFRLHGDLDTFRLEQACRKMVAANPILRTLFTTISSQVLQVVLRSYQIEFQRYGLENRADDAFVRWLVEQDTQRQAHLTQSIVRFKLLRHADGHYVLVMRVSHAQYDGMSLPLLYQDLEKCYRGEESILRPSFGSFIHAATAREGEAISFWSDLLEGSSMTEIVQHSGPAYKHNVDTMRTRTIPPIPTNVAGMSQATLVKAAWALVLAKMSGQRDVVFGNLVFGRNIPVSGIEAISGPCINMIPVRVRLDEMDTIQDLLALVQEQHLAAMPHESLGFRRLIKNCTDWPHWTRFSSVLQHQNLGRDGAQEFSLTDKLKCEMGVLGPAYDSSDLWVQTTPRQDSFNVEIGSCSAVVSPEIAEILLDRLCAVLAAFSSVGTGSDRHLWELLARDHAPLIPVKSTVVDDVWSHVFPSENGIPIAWDTPYFDLWGDEIAPVRFLEEYAEHGVFLDMEDILEHPTKQSQMILVAHVQADKNGSSKKAAPAPSPRSFWVLDSSAAPVGRSSTGSSAISSPRLGSPRIGSMGGGAGLGGITTTTKAVPHRAKKSLAHLARRGEPQRKTTNPYFAANFSHSESRTESYWDLPSGASWSANASTVSLSSPSTASSASSTSSESRKNPVAASGYHKAAASRPWLGRKKSTFEWA